LCGDKGGADTTGISSGDACGAGARFTDCCTISSGDEFGAIAPAAGMLFSESFILEIMFSKYYFIIILLLFIL